MSLIVKKTHCPDNSCKGEFTRSPYNSGDLFFVDTCNICDMKKLTHVRKGDILYMRGDKPIYPYSSVRKDS